MGANGAGDEEDVSQGIRRGRRPLQIPEPELKEERARLTKKRRLELLRGAFFTE
jgi:hypothetical protein